MSRSDGKSGQWLIWVGALLVTAVLGTGGLWVWNRLESIERHNADLAERAVRASEAARQASEQALRASTAATEASGRAQSAEQARQAAVEEKSQAEQARVQAEASAQDSAQKVALAEGEVERLKRERAQELDRMQQTLNKIVETRRTATGLTMNLSDRALHFEFDSAELSGQSRELLSRVAGILLATGGYGLAVHGHTDDTGQPAYNQQLSERRAASVREYLVSAGLEPGIISVKGYGQTSPVARGSDQIAKATNRRVEIVLTDAKIRFEGDER